MQVRFNHMPCRRTVLGGRTDVLFVRAAYGGASQLLHTRPFTHGQLSSPECVDPQTRVIILGADEAALAAARVRRPSAERMCGTAASLPPAIAPSAGTARSSSRTRCDSPPSLAAAMASSASLLASSSTGMPVLAPAR